MRSILVYILINCAVIGSFAKHARKPLEKRTTLTNEYFEKEAIKDIENVLSSAQTKNDIFEDEYDDYEKIINNRYDDYEKTINTYTSKKVIPQPEVSLDNVGEIVKHIQIEKRDATPVIHHSIQKIYLRNSNDSIISVDSNRLIKVLKRLAISEKANLRNAKDSGNYRKYSFDKKHLRYAVDDAVAQPEDHPVLRISEVNNVEKPETSEDDGKVDSDDTNDGKEVVEDKKHKNDEKQRLESSNLEAPYKFNKRLKYLRDDQNDNNKQDNSGTSTHLRSNGKIGDEDYSRRRKLRKERLSAKGNLRNLLKASTSDEKQQPILRRLRVAHDKPFKRLKRSTQAGYTEDPDTCKTYNENLAILWNKLSKYLNITEQPNERALHNIAIIIQAYLEHAKQAPETSVRDTFRHESRDKIGDVIVKVRKIINKDKAHADKITKIITNNLKPHYENSDTEDCEQVNEEYLSLSIDLLYKRYLKNSFECPDEDYEDDRYSEFSLRKQHAKTPVKKPPLVNMVVNSDFKPILINDELYNDYHKGKVSRQRPSTNKNRRVLKRKENENDRSHSVRRSVNRKVEDTDKTKLRSKSARKATARKFKKGFLKTHVLRNRCQKYAIRELMVSLRPVIERFMGLMECQVDNTMRSLNFDNGPNSRYYLYTSNFLPSEDSQRTRKNTEHYTGKSRLRKSHDTGHESHKNTLRRDIKFGTPSQTWIRKYGVSQFTNINSANPTVTKNKDSQEFQSDINKANVNNEYNTNDHEYVQSPPLYNDYDGTYKAHQANVFPSMVNPLISLNNNDNDDDKLAVRAILTNKVWASPRKGQREDDSSSEEFPDISESDMVVSYMENPMFGFASSKKDAHTIKTKSRKRANKYESITDFLKKARDTSLQTPEFVIPFAVNTNKGYVELTHLVKYPKVLVYRPQFIVKNTMPFNDFLKTMNRFNMTSDDARLLKIVRYLPDNNVQVLFESGDIETPFEIRDLSENRRSSSLDALKADRLQDDNDAANRNTNAGCPNNDRKDVASTFLRDVNDKLGESARHGSKESLSSSTDSNSKSNSLLNSDSNSTPISRSPLFTSLPSLGSIFKSSISGPDINKRGNSGFSSSSNLDSSSGSVDSLSVHSIANPEIIPGTPSSDSQNSEKEPSYNAVPIVYPYWTDTKPITSLSDSISHIPVKLTGVQKLISATSNSYLVSWWLTWKDKVMKEIKKILGKVDSVGNKIKYIVRGPALDKIMEAGV